MINKTKNYLRKNLVNIPGWRTNRKIVVIESDDWGSVRIPSRTVFDLFVEKGIPIDKNLRMHYFAKNDCLESDEDLTVLFELLSGFKDKNGNHPVITANAVVANPDFKRIKEKNLKEYYFEPISNTYERYPQHSKVLSLWKEFGIGKKMLWPQFHGREHVNVDFWMQTIRSDKFIEKFAFENEAILGISLPGEPVQNYNFMAAFEYHSDDQKERIENYTEEGLKLFENIFGFHSKSFIASCSVQGKHLDSVLAKNGVAFHQSGTQLRPIGNGKYKPEQFFWGNTNKYHQTYWRRNCTFEPSRNPEYDWAAHCLNEMKIAFRWGKPAVINSHRVNFSGGVFKENRNNTLLQLEKLLHAITKKWPDVEFITSEDLGYIVSNNKTNSQ